MLPLDSPKWSQLRHAYGSAANIPNLLRSVFADPYAGSVVTKEVWTDLFRCLCHQGDIYSASTPAVPHLVEAALSAKPGILAWEFIYLPVAIERSRIGRPEQLREGELDPEYLHAILRLKDVYDLTGRWGRNATLSKAVAAARRLLSRRRGNILLEQKPDPGPLFESGHV